jgi:hypothetical protein
VCEWVWVYAGVRGEEGSTLTGARVAKPRPLHLLLVLFAEQDAHPAAGQGAAHGHQLPHVGHQQHHVLCGGTRAPGAQGQEREGSEQAGSGTEQSSEEGEGEGCSVKGGSVLALMVE